MSTLMIGIFGSNNFGLTAGPCSGYWVISSSTGRFSARRIATTRVAWITLPAPTPIRRSASAARAASRARTIAASGDSFSISSKTPAHDAPSIARIRWMSAVLRETVRPQTMNARAARWRLNSAGRFSSASLPL
ncbi:hypothetical protein D3C83_08690 [compost metagenome]